MPELPEIENVVRGLQPLLRNQPMVERVVLRRKNLRVPFTPGLAEKLSQEKILAVHRRAKFILFETSHYWLINHLGMTGSWRQWDEERPHDHCTLEFSTGLKLVFNDPRRFGLLLLEPKDRLQKNRWLKRLGVEPLTSDFSVDHLYPLLRKRKAPVKNVIMDQQVVVGVGNIYASEALFRAGVRPQRKACRVSRLETERLVRSIRDVLTMAIEHGGSTIRSYTNAEGKSGNFQQQLDVYEREGQACKVCGEAIRQTTLGGRSSYWCGTCQK